MLEEEIYAFFSLILEKFTPDRKFLHRHRLWCLWQICGMVMDGCYGDVPGSNTAGSVYRSAWALAAKNAYFQKQSWSWSPPERLKVVIKEFRRGKTIKFLQTIIIILRTLHNHMMCFYDIYSLCYSNESWRATREEEFFSRTHHDAGASLLVDHHQQQRQQPTSVESFLFMCSRTTGALARPVRRPDLLKNRLY